MSSIPGLQAGTTYYVRAYATNSAGTAYGNELPFSTENLLVPVLSTIMVSSIGYTSAESGGNITYDGGGSVTARGVCWSTSIHPTVADYTTSDGTGTGAFTSSITGLTPGTTYYMRGYATNGAGTGYGDEISFPTKPLTKPVLTTTVITSVQQTSATGGGNITDDGGSSVTARGICWNTLPDPTIADSKTSDGTGTGTFESILTGLALNQEYYVRAYAINSVGISYGYAVYFSTNPADLATITTTAITSITITSASSGGNVTADGGSPVIARGVCYNTATDPSILNAATTDGTGKGSFTSSLSSLSAGTTYYLRAYATNAAGTAYGSELTFATNPPTVPVITTTSVSSVTQTTAKAIGNISSDGGAYLTAKGFCWSISSSPTLDDNFSHDGVGTGSYERNITSLAGNTTYYMRAYATNSVGTAYGNELSFKTGPVPPTLTTETITSILSNSASGGGNISSDGGGSITERGVCWSNVPNPTTDNDKTTSGTGTGSFTCTLTDLIYNTYYYVRAYAINSAGITYGDQVAFTTRPIVPVLTTTAISPIGIKSSTSGGNITNNGGASVTVRGVCWSTSVSPIVGTGNYTEDGPGSGSFVSSIAGLSADTKYYVRAYATNSEGIGYGDELYFTTYPATTPAVSTTAVSAIGTSTAMSGGNVTDDGGAEVTLRGVCWSETENPIASGDHTEDDDGIGSFISSITGLTASKDYYIRAYATNSVGTSYGDNVSFTTSDPCTSLHIVHEAEINGAPVDKIVDYGTVETTLTGEPKCWITRNLGATNQAASATDATEASAGWYFQFNNGQGYRHDGSNLTPVTWSSTIDEDSDWTSGNDPCAIMLGAGWRIPTYTEWNNADGLWLNYNDTYSSVLKIHVAGYLDAADGSLTDRGTSGHYWSATQGTNTTAAKLYISAGTSGMFSNSKTLGSSIRCIRD
jgi:hypothetical protein